MGEWTFFSNHGHVLVCLARDRDARLRDVAIQVGITERAVQKIVKDMQDTGYLVISKHGRRNRYRINNRKSLRHSLQSGCTVGQLVQLLSKQAGSRSVTREQVVSEKPKAINQKPEVKKPAPMKHAAPEQVEPTRPAAPPESPRQAEPVKKSEPPRQVEPPRQAEPPEQAETAKPESRESGKAGKKPGKSDLEQGQLF